MTASRSPKPPKPYVDPYLAGVGLGLVLLAAYALAGQGLGASGAFANVATGLVAATAPDTADANNYFKDYLSAGAPWTAWMVIEIFGVLVGGAVSAWASGRLRLQVVRGADVGQSQRLTAAAVGGLAMGFGAVLARGCTSGQALSGGALLSVGSWVFMIALFAGGFAVAPLVRRLWAP